MVNGKLTLLDIRKSEIVAVWAGQYTCSCGKAFSWSQDLTHTISVAKTFPTDAQLGDLHAGYALRVRDEINAHIETHEASALSLGP